jgi:hypothetical protein
MASLGWRMHASARAARNVTAAVLVAGLVAGTVVWQTDDTWPFAQMRMFPGGSESSIAITVIKADLADGRTKEMNPFAFHLKRADIEGQMDRIRANPRMLQDLIDAYNAHTPAYRRIERLVLVRREAARGVEPGDPRWAERELVRWPG